MADNVAIPDFSSASQTMATKQVSSTHYPYTTQLGVVSSANFTRPANTTAYTAKDAITNSTSAPAVMTFSSCARFNGGTIRLNNAIINCSLADLATPPNLNLLLFDTSVTPTNDNAAFALSDADSLHMVANLPLIGAFPFYVAGANNQMWRWEANSNGLLVKCASADTALYGLLRTETGFTPASGDVWTATLNFTPE